MTIASAFNEITENLGGTPSTSGTIAGAIDALNDTLAGSDQQAAMTIEGAIRLLGENIGGGGGGGTYRVVLVELDGQTPKAITSASVSDWEQNEVSVETATVELGPGMSLSTNVFDAAPGVDYLITFATAVSACSVSLNNYDGFALFTDETNGVHYVGVRDGAMLAVTF